MAKIKKNYHGKKYTVVKIFYFLSIELNNHADLLYNQ